MIVGNSMDATIYKIYKRIDDDSNEYEKVNFFDRGDNLDYDENYELVEYEYESYIPEDEWHQAIDYKSDEINLLIECDFCGDHFTITDRIRMDRMNSHRGTLRLAGYNIEKGEDSLYKDNCDKCKAAKMADTNYTTKGVAHFMHTVEGLNNFREKWMASMGKGFVKTSRGQRYLADLFQGDLNVPIGKFFADIVIDNKIIIEYDGGGHNLSVHKKDITQTEFNQLEKEREDILISKGYKILRFVSESEYFPEEDVTKRIVSEAIADLYLTNESRIVIKMGNKVNDPNYGKLKPIKRILEQSEFGGALL